MSYCGERLMWRAVIARALEDAMEDAELFGKPTERAHTQRTARVWLTRKTADFHLVCRLADWHPDTIQRAANKIIDEGLRRVEVKGDISRLNPHGENRNYD